MSTRNTSHWCVNCDGDAYEGDLCRRCAGDKTYVDFVPFVSFSSSVGRGKVVLADGFVVTCDAIGGEL